MVRLFETMFGGEKEMIPNPEQPHKEEEERVTGKIIKISEKGYGFISSKDIKFTRIFFHWTSLKQDTLHFTQLEKGMKVEFTPMETEDKGYRAIKIRVLEESEESDVADQG